MLAYGTFRHFINFIGTYSSFSWPGNFAFPSVSIVFYYTIHINSSWTFRADSKQLQVSRSLNKPHMPRCKDVAPKNQLKSITVIRNSGDLIGVLASKGLLSLGVKSRGGKDLKQKRLGVASFELVVCDNV